MKDLPKIGFGGGCHWCTEAVFMALKGVKKVEQGCIASKDNLDDFSEAVIVYFDEKQIGFKDLVEIHLSTHQSTQNHSMRHKYRSAIYYFEVDKKGSLKTIMNEVQKEYCIPLITKVLPFGKFKLSDEQFHNYYFSDTNKPFCKTHISPKITLLKEKFAAHVAPKV
ncbi:peptide-methionine (S)-S-oxide reductase [Maribacter sp. ACAM166]|uniref:peptide-methionine (S)-S-oxide reductase n=1 Tax=Maribacter sp. ACAM166 TaxID=2508996 RepID=UPI0010FD64E2|nr:peptide-methionine (S)-S-oxide reductase [Maribacter sp. ACAM166]TLP80269.1 peptide methionine sulfoxide reductase [Maribacter sp. ACAM166]